MSKNIRKRLGNDKGFTLVEIAVVLVIIGIILGAVLKGQDLMASARAKQLTSAINSWNALTFTYMDRIGRFPGDSGRDGLIGNTGAEATAAASAIGELTAAGAMGNAPQNPVMIGGNAYWVYIGYDSTGAAINRNIMIICRDAAGATAFTTEDLKIIQAVDVAIDGLADSGLGQFRAATAPVTLAGVGPINNRAGGAVTGVVCTNETSLGAVTPWAITQEAAVWFFDRPI